MTSRKLMLVGAALEELLQIPPGAYCLLQDFYYGACLTHVCYCAVDLCADYPCRRTAQLFTALVHCVHLQWMCALTDLGICY